MAQEARNENILFAKQEEEERKRLEEKDKGKPKKAASRTAAAAPKDGEFDELISSLRTGDVFSEDLARSRRRNRNRQGRASNAGAFGDVNDSVV